MAATYDSGGRGRGRGGRGARGRTGRSNPDGPSTSTPTSVPITVLSLHQPLASMIAYGLQRLDGRGWASNYRGPLWIHAAAKEPSAEDIEQLEAFHIDVYRVLVGDDEAMPQLPPGYPTSCLLGCVDMVDCVSVDEFARWSTLP